MPRIQGAAFTNAVLRRCIWALFVAPLIADARSLSQRHLRHQEAASPSREKAASPCAAWVQEHAGQSGASIAAEGQAPPCPCLVTPPPLMNAEQTQAVEVQAAADAAVLKGLKRIQDAAAEAAAPLKKELDALSADEVEKEAQTQLAEAEQNQTASLKLVVESEMDRQAGELIAQQDAAQMVAQEGLAHIRETAEQWATNQARNYIVLSSNGTMHGALTTARQTVAIRQEATELTKSAIKSAAQSLEVAKKAQAALDMVSKETMDTAKANANKMTEEQQALNLEIEATEASVREIAKIAKDSNQMSHVTLEEAERAEATAREALETSRSNALKIDKLKTRGQAAHDVAMKAKEDLDAKR